MYDTVSNYYYRRYLRAKRVRRSASGEFTIRGRFTICVLTPPERDDGVLVTVAISCSGGSRSTR